MKKVALCAVYLYMLCCPLEFALNVWFGSSVKYIALAAAVFMAAYFVVAPNTKIKIGAIQVGVLGWALLEAISILWTTVTKTTYATLTAYLMMAAFVFLISLFPFEEKEAEGLLIFFSLGSLILAVMVLTLGKVDGSEYVGRMTLSVLGRNQDPNGLAALVLGGALYSFNKIFQSKKFWYLYAVAFLIQIIAMFFTGSRGAMLSFVAAMLVFGAVKIPRGKRIPVIIISLIVIAAGFFALKELLPYRLFRRLFDFSTYSSASGFGRMKLWETALAKLVESPIFGFGTNGHIAYFSQTLGSEFAVHNTYLCAAFEVGIVGLLLFMTPIFVSLKSAFARKDTIVLTILVACLVAAFFLDALYSRYLWNAIMFGIVFRNIYIESPKTSNKLRKEE